MTERLAIDGGRPVRATALPYGRQCIDEDDIAAVVGALKSDFLTTGPRVAEFEGAFAAYVRAPHAVAFSSGTSALHAAVLAAEPRLPGSMVTSPLTFVASANCGVYVGLNPHFVDIDVQTWNLDLSRMSSLDSQTRVIVAVHYAGTPFDVGSLERPGVTIIEDACHALGAEVAGRRVGSCATSDMTAFSFHPVKHITTGEGGMVTTRRSDLAERLREIRHHGLVRDSRKFRLSGGPWHSEMQRLGYNYRITDVQCALGSSQLRKADRWLLRRREIASAYRAALIDDARLELPPEPAGVTSAWHLFPVALRRDRLTVDRARVFEALRAEGIGVHVHYLPVHLHPFYRERFGFAPGAFPVAESLYERLLSLPLFPAMRDTDVADVVRAMTKVLDAYGR